MRRWEGGGSRYSHEALGFLQVLSVVGARVLESLLVLRRFWATLARRKQGAKEGGVEGGGGGGYSTKGCACAFVQQRV
jgi:hypothetical protein